jgi:tetratricopeptide (TPR) repeat protein
MNTAVRVRERNGSWRQLSVGQAVAEASDYLNRGDDEQALTLLEKAVQHAPSVPIFRYLLGIAQVRRKLYEPAIANLEKAVRSDEDNVDYLVALGEALRAARPQEAVPYFNRAVALGSKSPLAYSRLAELLVEGERPEEALSVCDAGLAVCGEHPEILASRGLALKVLARPQEAFECLQKVVAVLPQDLGTLTNLAGTLLELGRVREARSYLNRALALKPDSATDHYNLGIALLLEGNYIDGFREYESRWDVRRLVPEAPVYPCPLWDGSELNGRRIVLHPEQGAGDAIQFVRYAELVRARGGRVIVLARPPLMHLMSWLEGCEVAALDGPTPPHELHCPLLSLPHVMRTDKDSIPPPARFVVPAPMKQKWNGILGEKTGTRIGVVWAGAPAHRNDRNRSFACRFFAPLLQIPRTQWFSLQVGSAVAQLDEPVLQGKIQDLAPHLTDYAETAAAIANLDLVITADTSVAHLAGSLGTPVWVLTPFAPDWRWLLDREDSPWYPGLRLFRQKVAGDWAALMQSVEEELRQWRPKAAAPLRSATSPDELARLAADFIPAGAHVLDLGCGDTALEQVLPAGCRYTPYDRAQAPLPAGITHVAALGVVEQIDDWKGFLQQLRGLGLPAVLSYSAALAPHLELQDLCAGFAEAGFHLQSSRQSDDNQVLLRLAPVETRLPVRRRVLVMSSGRADSFGDRLGIHLVNSLMPADTEVHHGFLDPWSVPPGDFDLLVLGIGDSLSQPLLTDQLIGLTQRIPRSVGIFGTHYRASIEQRRMADLLDRLTVWFARNEEDLLLHGAGRKNAVHLGDWLISAFPLTRWQRDETLRVGPDAWKDLPLDRTIGNIQKYRSVISERADPLLCSLTSAERVAYQESAEPSGRFRSLLMDVFGRTWPESHLFEFPREAVAAYRARTMRVMSRMPQTFRQLLESADR